jgi:dihydrodipicolinate reductase
MCWSTTPAHPPYARTHNAGVGVVAAGNFPMMAAILQRAAVLAAAHLDSWEILDYASAEKLDVPSGTARELADTLSQILRRNGQCHFRTWSVRSRREGLTFP